MFKNLTVFRITNVFINKTYELNHNLLLIFFVFVLASKYNKKFCNDLYLKGLSIFIVVNYTIFICFLGCFFISYKY